VDLESSLPCKISKPAHWGVLKINPRFCTLTVDPWRQHVPFSSAVTSDPPMRIPSPIQAPPERKCPRRDPPPQSVRNSFCCLFTMSPFLIVRGSTSFLLPNPVPPRMIAPEKSRHFVQSSSFPQHLLFVLLFRALSMQPGPTARHSHPSSMPVPRNMNKIASSLSVFFSL